MSSNAASSSSTPAPAQDLDIEKILIREASAFQREVEVERILKAFKLKYVRIPHLLLANSFNWALHIVISPYDILDIQETATGEEIKKKYRQISLCVSCFLSIVISHYSILPSHSSR